MKNIHWKKLLERLTLAAGVVSFLYGVLSFILIETEDHAFNTLMGMFAGLGVGIIAYAVSVTIREKRMSPEKKEQLEIEQHDERNIAINSAACSVGFTVSIVLMGVLAFVFTAMGLREAGPICVGCMYLIVISTQLARISLNKKM